MKLHKWTPVRNIFKATKEEPRAEKAWVPTKREPPCEECGCRGTHFCVGKNPQTSKVYSKRRDDDLPMESEWMK